MKALLSLVLGLSTAGTIAAQNQPVFLPASPTTVAWGYYWSKAKPVLTVHSGDTVRIQTLSTCGSSQRLEEEGVPAAEIPPYNQPIYDQVKDRGPGGHILTGPVAIAEAEPGDVLEVQILKIDLDAPFACNGFAVGRGFLPNDYPYCGSKIIPLDPRRYRALCASHRDSGASLLAAWGTRRRNSQAAMTARPWMHAGNMDNKLLVAGTTLYVPVHARGALFEVGDGHAGQGNGEVDITAMETFLTGTFRFIVHKDQHLLWPRAETPTSYISMGFSPDLDGDGNGGPQHDRLSHYDRSISLATMPTC